MESKLGWERGPGATPPVLTEKEVALFREIATLYSGFVVLFRSGDFYVLVTLHAELAKRLCSIPLEMQQGITVAFVPRAMVFTVVRKFVQTGYFVALCSPALGPSEDLFS